MAVIRTRTDMKNRPMVGVKYSEVSTDRSGTKRNGDEHDGPSLSFMSNDFQCQ